MMLYSLSGYFKYLVAHRDTHDIVKNEQKEHQSVHQTEHLDAAAPYVTVNENERQILGYSLHT